MAPSAAPPTHPIVPPRAAPPKTRPCRRAPYRPRSRAPHRSCRRTRAVPEVVHRISLPPAIRILGPCTVCVDPCQVPLYSILQTSHMFVWEPQGNLRTSPVTNTWLSARMQVGLEAPLQTAGRSQGHYCKKHWVGIPKISSCNLCQSQGGRFVWEIQNGTPLCM